ncbi:MAG TPA: type III pantothenate kinase [Thermomicrobiaceae bacterium]|nr:type III pantothenate kinase [Thermomicrobiaceae bacterium]
MLLAVDIGNTNIVVGLYDGASLRTSWRMATERAKMPDEWWAVLSILAGEEAIDLRALSGSVVASVVPRLTETFVEMIERRLGRPPVVVSAALDLGIRVEVDNPYEVGADRLADAVAVRARHGAPAVVVDFGTGTNFDVVSPEGAYIGGAIAPGVKLALEALTGQAARLTAVELAVPPSAIGHNTIRAVQSGTVLGYLGLVEGLLARIERELGAKPAVIATGGLGAIFAAHSPAIDAYEPDLTLEGLRLIFERVAAR